ncbi:unknown [Acidiphilium sp. CAG:727]|nr:unknown [Acidiphilium sp. CAG:727]
MGRFNEYFAKIILENCFPNKFQNIEVSDKPDLRYNVNKIGIEVAYCMPNDVAEAFYCIERYEKAEDIPEKTLKKARKAGITVDEQGVLWNQDSYGDNIAIEKTPIRYFLDMVRQKVERLNSENADYADMKSYELFINSPITMPNWFKRETFQVLKNINNRKKQYDTIYLLLSEPKLLVFNLKENKYDELLLLTWRDKFAEKALELKRIEGKRK